MRSSRSYFGTIMFLLLFISTVGSSRAPVHASPAPSPPGPASSSSSTIFERGKIRHAVMDQMGRRILEAELGPPRRVARLLHPGPKDGSYNPIIIDHLVIDLEGDEGAGTLDATIDVFVSAIEDQVTHAEFLLESLGSLSVATEDGTPLPFEIDDTWGVSILIVTLPRTLASGESAMLRLRQSGQPDCSPDPYFGMEFCSFNESLVFFASAEWVPVKAAATYEDYYASSPTVDYIVSTPPDCELVSTGESISVNTSGQRWVHRAVDASGVGTTAFAYAPFASYTAGDGPILSSHLHTGTTDFGQAWADRAADIVDFYSARYTPFAYHGNALVQATEALGGGVSLGTLTMYYASAFGTSPEEALSEQIFSHEIGHSWWAYMYRSADPDSPWLVEGINEYSSRLYGYARWPAYWVDYIYKVYFKYFQLYVDPADEVPLTGPGIYTDDSTIYYLITYNKGAHVMRMLEWWLGSDVMEQAMRRIGQEFDWSSTRRFYGVNDLRQILEDLSGVSLGSFFERWIHGVGYPRYRWEAEFFTDPSDYAVEVRVEEQMNDGGLFGMPVEVAVWSGDATEPMTQRLEFTDGVAQVVIPLAAEPRGVRLDPGFVIWGEKIPALAGDMDGSNEVDGRDLVYAAWAQGGSFLSNDPNAAGRYIDEVDFDRDGVIDSLDLDVVIANFGKRGTIQRRDR